MSEILVKYRNYILTFTILLSFGMHYRHLNKELMSVHVWRQTQTQSTIINFYEEDFNILNPRKNDRGATEGYYRMEFPLMQWLVACLYKIFGNHLIISRLSMFVIGAFSVLGMYKLLQSLFNNVVPGIIGAFAFTFSPCFFYYTINPIPDNMALMASIWGLALFFTWKESGKASHLILAGVMLSIGTLCKLPFIIYYAVPGWYFTRKIILRDQQQSQIVKHAFMLLLPVLLPVLWYIKVIPGWKGNGITSGVLDNQIPISSMLDILQHNLVSTLPELLINYGSVSFFIAGFYFFFKKRLFLHRNFALLLILFLGLLVYFFFEINMIGKVHDYYLFPFFPILFIIVGFGAFSLLKSQFKSLQIFTLISLISLPLFAEARMASRWNPNTPGVNKDLYTYKTELRNAVPKDALCVVGNDISHFIMLYYLDKKGWCFDDGKPDLSMMISQGAQYLYLDTKNIHDLSHFAPFTDSLIMQRGTIQVYHLN